MGFSVSAKLSQRGDSENAVKNGKISWNYTYLSSLTGHWHFSRIGGIHVHRLTGGWHGWESLRLLLRGGHEGGTEASAGCPRSSWTSRHHAHGVAHWVAGHAGHALDARHMVHGSTGWGHHAISGGSGDLKNNRNLIIFLSKIHFSHSFLMTNSSFWLFSKIQKRLFLHFQNCQKMSFLTKKLYVSYLF